MVTTHKILFFIIFFLFNNLLFAADHRCIGNCINGYGELTYEDEQYGNYVGEFVDGKFHGKGTHTYPSGDKYVGDFSASGGIGYDGKGVYHFTNGEKFEGRWANNKPLEGTGTFHLSSMETLSLAFMKVGGTIKAYPSKFTGDWKNGRPFGQGKITYSDASSFYGMVKESQPNGYGTRIHKNGDKHVGEWSRGIPEGQGEGSSADGSVRYVGVFKNGRMEGRGSVTLHGKTFTGQFHNNLPEGHGVLTLENGDRLDVEYKNGKRIRGFQDDVRDFFEGFEIGFKIGSLLFKK